ncbi:YkvA family protein [Fibrobacter sp. UWB13]|uniref:YkvA family protein n=1 Tax=Fibrobacter sp. UWB13 TaxID=1896204 RepID=UPI000A09F8BA|nr:DUF1232 domain-containing protein [Fibrobacter sp. UWB13]SMG07850.1 Protein of unknown function [Fibrobacter sp. UWB13]
MANGKVYDDVEVHDMNDGFKSSNRANVSMGDEQNGAPVVWKALSVIIAMLAVVYDLSPIDAVPDTIPLFGWLDDVGFTVMAALNAYQQFAKDQNSMVVRLAKYVKWMMVAFIVLAGVAVGGLITAIVALVMH